MFRVGQKVVCIDDSYTNLKYGERVPVKDRIYTIREFAYTGLRIEEIVNEPNAYAEGFAECAFALHLFRPVVERSTDISALTALLNPANHRYLEGV